MPHTPTKIWLLPKNNAEKHYRHDFVLSGMEAAYSKWKVLQQQRIETKFDLWESSLVAFTALKSELHYL